MLHVVSNLDHRDGPEGLLGPHRGVARGRDQNARADGAALLHGLERKARALGDRFTGDAHHPVGLGARDHGAQVGGGVLGGAHLERLGGGHEQVEEGLQHRALHDHPLGRHALLA